METFSIDKCLSKVYDKFPEAKQKPLIAITTNYADGSAALADKYYKQVVAAGGAPLLIPPIADTDVIISTLDHVDGLLLTGGADVNPLWQGDDPLPGLGGVNGERDLPELITIRLAMNRQLPILGICRGIQALALALGGKVEQDISATQKVKHSQEASRGEVTHMVNIAEGSLVEKILGVRKMAVNSMHHQAVGDTGNSLVAVAWSSDGIIEAVESAEHKPVIGVQWHPEWLGTDGLPLFKWLIDEASLMRKTKRLHNRIITLDSHCDTPMFFPQGIDFATRDNSILVDLHKMSDGRQDAVTMAAYLPQPEEGQTFQDCVDFDVTGPKAYADLIFDKIDKIIDEHPMFVAKACSHEEIAHNKYDGKKSILLGIENGLALEGDLDNVDHFANRGVCYITLCHNGDNDICDSAQRSVQTHGGVSDFGEQVIRRMNDTGVMVDLSHAAESSFYDAIEISSKPVVCSHSNTKALCDVPRNLTDEQMRKLAENGGVMQITMYIGFLKAEGEASILDALAHLDHAVKVMGIDHVGIGTDFDGDGGVPGIADSSEMINFTRALLRRKYSNGDIAKIWGLNWLRVLESVRS